MPLSPEQRIAQLKAYCATLPHGVYAHYAAGCRCLLCRQANATKSRADRLRRKLGDHRNYVRTWEAKIHIHELRLAGVGTRIIADAAGVSLSTVRAIASGKRAHIRQDTARHLLEVTAEARAEAVGIDAAPSWVLLDEMLDLGYSRRELGNFLGRDTVDFGRDRISVRSAGRIARMYRAWQAGRLQRR